MENQDQIWIVAFWIVVCLVGVWVGVWGIMILWNALIPSITGFKEINFWQTLGLMILGRALTSIGKW
jgi:membrane protein YqaA with SNARE-associated domain